MLMLRPIACALVACLAWTQQAPVTFRSGIDVVNVDVSVRDRSRVITGLTATDFLVLDNDVTQDVVDVSFDKLPIDVTVALDISSSVTGDTLGQLQRAVAQMMKDLGKADRLRLMTFHARLARVVDFTDDVAAVQRAIRNVTAGGGTSIFDTISTALISADQAERRQLLMVFTDGADSTSIIELSPLIDVARRTNVAVSTVMPVAMSSAVTSSLNGALIVTSRMAPGNTSRTRPFQRLAEETGGQVIPQVLGGDLSLTFRRVLDEFRSSYVVRYVPKGVTRGGLHTLKVTVPKRNGFTVRFRRGYAFE